MYQIQQGVERFRCCFGRCPDHIAYAAGRVTVIGGHTDYNGGLVVSAPLPRGTVVALGTSSGCCCCFTSDQQPAPVHCNAESLADPGLPMWARYIGGVLCELGCVKQAVNVSVTSDLPACRGLASSAALTVATALAACRLLKREMPAEELALLCQRVEGKYLNVRCGLLDPYTALHAREGHLLFLDCAERSHRYISMPRMLALVVCESGVDRQLAASLYNLRRSECQQVAMALGREMLRGARPSDFERLRSRMPIATRRADHVLAEIDRVSSFCAAMQRDDFDALRTIMADSHASCRDVFQCSHPRLDALVERANRHPSCVGSRMTGGGWGGATINLVYRDQVENFCREVSPRQPCIAW